MEIPNGPEAPAQARRLVDQLELPEPARIDTRLILSELVTNSYKFAGNPPGAPIEVTIVDTEDELRLEVLDRSIFDPTPETTEELRSEKWGLVMVDRLADAWGRISEGGIWGELKLRKPGA
jgi:anti-sigma regulatory factor (Ser/Thr protein kinase)